ncbi:sigma-54 dependent transcriptional regulator [Thioalkalivibrio sp.]|uniref:sigma-54-dependent transcriptional regulator n=1 Tax=Thioalkalivibrio sp. TaxID=2093813 RepID=UPI0012D5DB98|nr:sigma-54 dependent transcriptional regulator [Thioalkalivibrio sp.]TVP80913.1 MAG: sigma-54-dependent Fis family transcriptional regulator [Thioalkalivibrio sp.]
MSIKQVLVVDDEPDICELLEITLQRMGIETVSTTRMRHAVNLLGKQRFDLCLTDMRMPDGDGLELVQHIQRHCPELPVAVITAHGCVDTAVRALQLGAFDFVTKPVDLPLLRRLVDSALRLARPEAPGPAAQAPVKEDGASPLLGRSGAMMQLRATVARLARSQAPVIVLGESGSGKELVAREIHRLGPRSAQPFVPVNCGAIPSELMESEFFGHQKGAFTGAIQNKTGLFREAHGGTLFLDEVAELPLALQVKLLRALQERAIKPVGANREESVDVRIVSATHKNLADEVQHGRFRQDLFYRLNVVELRAPPLRERPEDIAELAAHILRDIAAQWQISGLALSPAALDRLCGYPFPGNVRELENILERAAVMVDGPLIGADTLVFPERNRNAESASMPATHGVGLDDHLAEQERRALEAALEQAAGNRTAAARTLGLSFRQMRYRLKKLGID